MQENTAPQDRRLVPGYEDLYEIDQQGNVYAIQDHKHLKAGRLMKTRPDIAGYIFATLTKHGHTRRHSIHRLLMLAFNPIEGSEKLEVNHKDGNRGNNDLSNLEWMTHAENMKHAGEVLNAWQKRNQRGNNAGYRKLTEDKVREIRRLWAAGATQTKIASMYGVSQENIGAIVHRRIWGHVE